MAVYGSWRFITPSTESLIARPSALTSKNKKTQSVHENVPVRFLETEMKVKISFLSSCLLTCEYWIFCSEANSPILPPNLLCKSTPTYRQGGGMKPHFSEGEKQESCSSRSVTENLGRGEYAVSR